VDGHARPGRQRLLHPVAAQSSAAPLHRQRHVLLRGAEGAWTVLGRRLGWPDEEIDEGFLQQLRDAGVDERELTGFYVTRPPEQGRPRFLFQRREKSRPASYPIHLDFGTDDREAEIERLTGAGASVVETKVGPNITFTIVRDPEGNPFCFG